MNLEDSFGNWLRQRRKALDLTQVDLAQQVGCAPVTIRKIEAGERRPSKQISERMADVLAIPAEDRSAFITFARRLLTPEQSALDDVTATHNLPSQTTPFIGRERELAQIAERLADPSCRLLTLLGPGGIGKTRLGLQAAAEQSHNYRDGVYFVSLTPIGTTTFIPAAIASVLKFSFYGQEPPEAQITNYLRGKHMLLVLDNYEHLLAGIHFLADLLANAPRLKLLVTSRERLNIRDEWVLSVEGLPYPTRDSDIDAGDYSAVELFVRMAQRTQPNFLLADHRDGVVDICRVVEGMPLGIELAASWLRAMPCAQIAEQMRHDLDFLATPLHDVAERHRSLRAVFEHSRGLLSEAECDAVMKLSVFRGGCDAAAAEAVAGADLSMLAGLVDKSLVRLNAAGRYEMHELLRQFAADKLLEAGIVHETRGGHLQYYLSLTERIEGQFYGPQHLTALDQLEAELDNFRAALDWASLSGAVESGLRLAGNLGFFWNVRVYWNEGREWLEMFLASAPEAPVPARAKVLLSLLEINDHFHDATYTQSIVAKVLNLMADVENPHLKAWLLYALGSNGHPIPGKSEAYLNEALAMFQQLGNQRGIYETLSSLAQRAFQLGDFTSADQFLEEAIGLARQAGDKHKLSWLLMLSGCKNWYEGNIDQRTESLYQESLSLFLELDYKLGIMMMLSSLGKFARLRGENEQARSLFEKSLLFARRSNDKGVIPMCLILLAEIFSECGEAERGARILGAVRNEVQTRWIGDSFSEREVRMDYERALVSARSRLDEAQFAAAFAEGQRMTLDEAIALALADAFPVEAASSPVPL